MQKTQLLVTASADESNTIFTEISTQTVSKKKHLSWQTPYLLTLKEKLHLKLEYYYGTQISTPFNFILCQSKRCLHGQLEINSATR